jgi:hypothetical protein
MPGKAPRAMNNEEEAGSDKVTACTRAFEEIDAQVFPGPGRGATLSEAAASDRWGGPSAATVEAYRRMFDIVVRHQRAYGRVEPAGPQVTDHFGDQDRVAATTRARRHTRPTSSTGATSSVTRRAISRDS